MVPASIQEAAANFANSILGQLNAAAANAAGVDVLWFRLQPDHRSQDVIFQSYTLYGVEDCPISIKAIYSDNGYDDAAITYNIMGINFAIPMTLDIALEAWKEATENDGTIPQKGDIIFIPISRKLMEVVSMQPIKSLGAQLTGYKVNLGIYTPTRSRIVGENLRESIEDNTTNLEERFGDKIVSDVDDIVDDDQLSIYNSTSQDKHKNVKATKTEDSMISEIRSIESYNLVVDGHTVSRSHYRVYKDDGVFVRYSKSDSFTKKDWRCLSCWVCPDEVSNDTFKNIRGDMRITTEDGSTYIETTVGNNFKDGEDVVIRRGTISIPGKVSGRNKILVNGSLIKELRKNIPNIESLPGFTIFHDNVINLINSDAISIRIKGSCFVSIETANEEQLIGTQVQLTPKCWYGIVVNIGDTISADIYGIDNHLERISSTSTTNNLYETINIENYYIAGSDTKITNIRLYKTRNNDTDKQITDLVSYNADNNSEAIVNDSADIYLNKPYTGRQR